MKHLLDFLQTFQNFINIANEDVVNDDETFVELLTNSQNIINVANEDVNDIKHGAKCDLKRKPQ
jgi:hypothetical protein